MPSARSIAFNLALIHLVNIYVLLQLHQYTVRTACDGVGDFIIAVEKRRDVHARPIRNTHTTPAATFVNDVQSI